MAIGEPLSPAGNEPYSSKTFLMAVKKKSSATDKKPRTRLKPEDRKNMILDTAAKLVASEGVSAVTMERLGKEAGTSKALIYNYFPDVTVLLQSLLVREYRHLRRQQLDAAEDAATLEHMVRKVTHVYLSYIRERGLIIERLSSEPAVANNGDPTAYNREGAVRYMAEIISSNFHIDMDVALATVDISYGIPAAAGHYITHNDADIQQIEDITVLMILGAFNEVRREYPVAIKPLLPRSARRVPSDTGDS